MNEAALTIYDCPKHGEVTEVDTVRLADGAVICLEDYGNCGRAVAIYERVAGGQSTTEMEALQALQALIAENRRYRAALAKIRDTHAAARSCRQIASAALAAKGGEDRAW